ncbi:MAG: DUF6067 family protein, partial [Planctomycetota bacterium]
MIWLCVLALVSCVAGPAVAGDDEGEKDRVVLLDTASFWRHRVTWGTDVVRLESGELAPIHPARTTRRIERVVDGRKRRLWVLRPHDEAYAWSLPAAGWARPDLEDGGWARLEGPFCVGPYGCRKRSYRSTPLLCLRGKFRVDDPAKVGDLALSVSYLGGMVVYVNGRELTRGHLPDGELEATTPAADYPERAFFDEKGSLWVWTAYRTDEKGREAFELRLRRLSVRVPASILRKGVNVVALENHRSPAPEGFFLGKNEKYRNIKHVKAFCWWSRVGVRAVRLTAAEGAAATPNAAHTGRPKGVQVWTWPIHRMVSARDYADPCEPLDPVRLCGARNGAYSGQVVIGSDRPIRGLEVDVSALKGPAVLPASAVEVRYPLCSVAARRGRGPFFDGLEAFAPATVPVRKGEEDGPTYGAVQPIWLTVHVPTGAKPGRYSGTVTVRARDMKPVDVPLAVEVVDWTLPDPTEFFTHLGLIQSPDSLAMQYDVPAWSEPHWKLLDRTFELLGEVGNKVIWITAQRKTHFGSEHAMIRWSRGADGELEPDLSVAERYL